MPVKLRQSMQKRKKVYFYEIFESFIGLLTCEVTLWILIWSYWLQGITKHFSYKKGYEDGFRMGRLEEKIMGKEAKNFYKNKIWEA